MNEAFSGKWEGVRSVHGKSSLEGVEKSLERQVDGKDNNMFNGPWGGGGEIGNHEKHDVVVVVGGGALLLLQWEDS